MGNIFKPCKETFEDLDETTDLKVADSNPEARKSQKSQSNPTKLEKFASIRNDNLRNKLDLEQTQRTPNANTIVEEAVLEDLCEEADEELDSTKNGPMTNNQKAKLLQRLSTNVRTKHHFESPDNFETFVSEKIKGDTSTKNNLNIVQKQLKRQSSNTSFGSILSNRNSIRSLARVSSRVSNRVSAHKLPGTIPMARGPSYSNINNMEHRISTRDLTAHIKNNILNQPNNRPSNVRMSVMSRHPDLKTITERTLTDTVPDEERRTSSATTYSLPNNFVTNDLLPMNEIDRQKQDIVCKTNKETLEMANQLLQKGNLKDIPQNSDSDDDEGCGCYCNIK